MKRGCFVMSATERMHQLTVADATIEYSERGTGDPVLLVHAGMYADWFAQLASRPELEAYRIVRIRRAGYASGPPPSRHLRIEDHAAHLAALMAALRIDRAHICGHSSSAFIALQLAIDHPDAARSLVLLEPALGKVLDGPVAAAFAQATVAPAMQAAAASDLAGAFDTWMRGVGGAGYADTLDRALGQDECRAAIQQSAFFFRDEGPAVREWDFDANAAATVSQPTLLVAGEQTVEAFRAVVQRLAVMLPNAEASTLAGADHLMPLTHPAELAEVIAGFVACHPIRGPVRPSSRA